MDSSTYLKICEQRNVLLENARFITSFTRSMIDFDIPASVLYPVLAFMLAKPGHCWRGCLLSMGRVELAIPQVDGNEDHYALICKIEIVPGKLLFTSNKGMIAIPTNELKSHLDTLEYVPVVIKIDSSNLPYWESLSNEIMALDDLPTSIIPEPLGNVNDLDMSEIDDHGFGNPMIPPVTEFSVNAKVLVDRYGEKLIDLQITTQAMGEWPGGLARVTMVWPDALCPEIVMQVANDHGEIGVFAEENVLVSGDWLKANI